MNGDDQPVAPPSGNWDYRPDPGTPNDHATDVPEPVPAKTIAWTASEYIAHEKGAGWYLALFGITVVVAGLVYLITRDKISTGVVVVVAIIFGIAGGRKPRTLHYQVDDQGLTIGNRFYPYANFRSFTILSEGAFSSIAFTPLRRFMPSLSIYYAPDDEDKIVSALADRLPMETGDHDLIDRFMRRIHF